MAAGKKGGQAGNKEEDKLDFKFLPAFAAFLLKNKLEEYARQQISFSREEKVPLLKFFEHLPEKDLLELGKKSGAEFLRALANNKAKEFIQKSTSDYVKNNIISIDRELVVAEDITIISFVRRKTFRKFLTYYTDNFTLIDQVMEEVDRFIAVSETASFNSYILIQQEKINRINEELEARQEQLLEAQSLADMGSFFWDIRDKKSTYTPGVMKIFEMEKTSNLEAFLQDVHEEDREKVQQAIEKSFKDGLYECEYRFIKKKKEKKIWSRGIVTFEDGKPVNMKGTIMDITKKNRMLEKLQESEQLNKQAQAITHIGNWSWNISEDEVKWSDEMYRIYGLEPQSEKINFNRFISLIHPDDRQKRIDEIQESLKMLHANDYLLRIVNPDGKIKILQGKGEVITGKNKKPVRLVGTCQDITHEYNLNKEIQEKEANLKQLINNAPDAVIVIDTRSVITLWNPKTEEIFGWKAEEVLGKTLTETIIPPQYRDAHKAGMQRLLETGVGKILNQTLELSALRKNGKEFHVSLTISQSLQQGKTVFIAFLRDISIEKQNKAELQSKTQQLEKLNLSLGYKNEELERINKELESFNYVASHDLQEPLRKIQTFTNRIIEKGRDVLSPSTLEYFDKIITSSARMQLLIEDLLTFSQTNAEENNFVMADMNIILEEVKNILSAAIEEKKAVIEAMPLPILQVVPFQIQQLLVNLISNAIKYAKENTAPHIKISSDIVKGEKTGIPGATAGKNYFELKVADNGIGFDSQHADKIFGLFQRLHSKDKYSGTGIGLAICKKIAHNHNGFIRAESVPGKGSTFYVFLPKESSVIPKEFVN